MPSLSTLSSSNKCSKCGIAKKSGKFSCCARGGSWFKNCGDAADSKFDHTWAEGIRACQGFTTSISAASPLQGMLIQARITAYQTNINQSLNDTRHRSNTYRHGNMSNAVTTGSGDRARLAKVTVCICVLFGISYVQK